MTTEIKTGQQLDHEYMNIASMNIEYGVLRDGGEDDNFENDEYELVTRTFGSLVDDENDTLISVREHPLYLISVDLIELMAQEDDIGAVLISKLNREHNRFMLEVWKNLSLAKSAERVAV